ncbi:hypothetical protein B0H14DRAFT_3778738 [Mycena olivaceomarginata]|nr:hypothetical protein B0H14DRAFT_3778738 [Mycena olivaceomarginata]
MMRISTGEDDARQHKDRTDMRTVPQCSEPRRGLFTHAHDPILLKSTPAPVTSYVFTCTPYRYVPQEIIDLITSHMASTPASLLAYTLVSSVGLCPDCRVFPLRSPCFPMLSPAPARLHTTLLRAPHLAAHVRDLTIHRPHASGLWAAPDSPLPALLVSLFYVGLDPAEKARKRKVRPRQPQLLEAVGTPEYLNLSLDSKVGKVLEHMQEKGGAPTSNYFSRVRRLALNPIPNSAGSAQNFAMVLCAVEDMLECWRCSGTKHEAHTNYIDLALYDPARSRLASVTVGNFR